MPSGLGEAEDEPDEWSTSPGWYGEAQPSEPDDGNNTSGSRDTLDRYTEGDGETQNYNASDLHPHSDVPTKSEMKPRDEPPPARQDTPSGATDVVLPLSPNQLIHAGRYRLLDQVGQGGFGEVWKVRDTSLDVTVAIKFLDPRFGQHDDFAERFRREARNMRKLESVHAVKLYDYSPGATPFIVMEFVNGLTLRKLLKEPKAKANGMPIDLVGRLLKQLCEVLEEARTLGLVHRDLKPENLMLLDGKPAGHEHLKVLDFGIAKIFSADTDPGGDPDGPDILTRQGDLPICTVEYASPEQCAGHHTDHRSDLYTVGVILYEMLTGRLPFKLQGKPFAKLATRTNAEAGPPSQANPQAPISPAMDAVILKCLELKPEHRYQTPDELLAAFLTAANEERTQPQSDPGSNPITNRSNPSVGASDLVLPLSPNQVVSSGRYELLECLGRGGFGEVWKARDTELDMNVAIKVLYSKLSTNTDFVTRFRREAKIMMMLDSLHAVKIYTYFPGTTPFILMEFLKGKTLRDDLRGAEARTRGLPIDLVGRILGQLCEVLEKARTLGLVHRDLKPENLMLLDGKPAGHEHLKVLDFGIAKIFSADTDGPTSAGGSTLVTQGGAMPMCTPAYASPEQAASEPTDHRSDLFTVGVILYEMLTGRLPFEARATPMLTLLDRMTARAAPPSKANPQAQITPAMDAVILKCLALDPAQRYQTPTELFHAYYHAAREVVSADKLIGNSGTPLAPPPFDPPPGPTSTGPKRARKPRPLLVASSAVAMIALAAAGWAAMNPNKETTKKIATPSPIEKILAKAEYAPAEGTAFHSDGWPEAIAPRSSNKRFVRVGSGLYLPEGYAPVSTKDGTELASDGWPAKIERVGTTDLPMSPEEAAVFLRIPAPSKPFPMGFTSLDLENQHEHWSPQSSASLPQGFYIQVTECTNGEIHAAYPKAPPEAWVKYRNDLIQVEKFDRETVMRFPAVMLSAEDMKKYASLRGGILPSEREWEYVARLDANLQPTKSKYIWGDEEFNDNAPQANVAGQGMVTVNLEEFRKDVTAREVRGLAGNVRERCRNTFKRYGDGKSDHEDYGPPYAIRGSSWNSGAGKDDLLYYRHIPPKAGWEKHDGADTTVGFRLVLHGLEFGNP